MMERDCLLARWLTMTELAWMHVALDFGGRGERKKDERNYQFSECQMQKL